MIKKRDRNKTFHHINNKQKKNTQNEHKTIFKKTVIVILRASFSFFQTILFQKVRLQ